MERFLQDVLGLLLIGIGFIVLPTPLPFGIILIGLGAILLAASEEGVRNLIRERRKDWKKFDEALGVLERNLPEPLAKVVKSTKP